MQGRSHPRRQAAASRVTDRRGSPRDAPADRHSAPSSPDAILPQNALDSSAAAATLPGQMLGPQAPGPSPLGPMLGLTPARAYLPRGAPALPVWASVGRLSVTHGSQRVAVTVRPGQCLSASPAGQLLPFHNLKASPKAFPSRRGPSFAQPVCRLARSSSGSRPGAPPRLRQAHCAPAPRMPESPEHDRDQHARSVGFRIEAEALRSSSPEQVGCFLQETTGHPGPLQRPQLRAADSGE